MFLHVSAPLRGRFGSAELLVLSLLEDQPRHGYDVSKLIQLRSRGALRFHVTSLYPLLHRLEEQGWIEGKWVEKAGQRRRRYYQLTAQERRVLRSKQKGWLNFVALIGHSDQHHRAEPAAGTRCGPADGGSGGRFAEHSEVFRVLSAFLCGPGRLPVAQPGFRFADRLQFRARDDPAGSRHPPAGVRRVGDPGLFLHARPQPGARTLLPSRGKPRGQCAAGCGGESCELAKTLRRHGGDCRPGNRDQQHELHRDRCGAAAFVDARRDGGTPVSPLARARALGS